MQEFQKRVVDEKHGLDQKIKDLEAFIGTPTYKDIEHAQQFLLRRQLVAMHEYSSILAERIELFGREVPCLS